MKKYISIIMLILISSLALTACSETAFMNERERAEYNRIKQIQEEEKQRLDEEERQRKIEEIRKATGGECMYGDYQGCYSNYKLKQKFITICKNYGHKQNTAAFNQCVGMEKNNYERDKQLNEMKREAAARAESARRELLILQRQSQVRNYPRTSNSNSNSDLADRLDKQDKCNRARSPGARSYYCR